MKKIFILFLINIFSITNAMVTPEKVKAIKEKYWEIHHTHSNKTYEGYQEIIRKFKNREIDEDDVLRRFTYFPTKDLVTVETITKYTNQLYNFTYNDDTCYLCFEEAKRWYWKKYEKD